jgi:hypothetical protein
MRRTDTHSVTGSLYLSEQSVETHVVTQNCGDSMEVILLLLYITAMENICSDAMTASTKGCENKFQAKDTPVQDQLFDVQFHK